MADLKRRGIYVSNLQMALSEGEHGLSAVPGHIRKIIEEDMWQDRIVQATGERAQYDRFTEFIADSPPEGLGTDVGMLKRMCAEDEEALRLLRAALKSQGRRTDLASSIGPAGSADLVDNINEVGRSGGTSKSYTLDRLAREDPELYEQVTCGELSANQAAIKAGFRAKRASIPVHKGGEPQIERAARGLARHFDGHLRELIDELRHYS
jgi:hypothetical protein